MSDTLKHYSLPEVAKLAGVDEKMIHLYAHKGLIAPHHSNNSAGFTDIDCTRLKIIKRADELGYTPEDIFNLIGHPDKLRNAKNPVAECKNFAISKYKQIYEELGHCEPLEQIKKKCDLKLITNYIKHLKELQQTSSDHRQAKKRDVPGQSRPVENLARKLSKGNEQPSTLSHDTQRPDTRPPQTPQIDHQDRKRPAPTLLLKKPLKQIGVLSILACIVIALAYMTFFLPSSGVDEKTQSQASLDEPTLQDEAKVPRLEQAAEPTPPPSLKTTEKETAVETKRPQTQKPDEAQPPGKKSSGSDSSLAEQQVAERSSVAADSVNSQTASTSPTETHSPDHQAVPEVFVEDLSLSHNSVNNTYLAEFKVVRNQAAKTPQPVSGYAFVRLQVENETQGRKDLVMPPIEFSSGKPSWLPRSGQFLINNYRQMSFEAVSSLLPDEISSIQVLVYSPEKELLLSESFSIPIQPYFPQPEQTMAPSDGKSVSIPPSIPISAPAPESPSTIAVSAAKKADLKVSEGSQPSDTKPRKTDDPEAVDWEQRSYEAAVKGYFDRAIADATKAIELDPGRVNPYINRSWAYIEKGLLDQAILDAKTALLIDPQNTYALNNLGLSHQRKSEMTMAQEYYQQACTLGLDLGCENLKALTNQSRIKTLIDQSQTAFNSGDWDTAIRAATEVIDLDPKNAVAYTNRSAAYAQINSLNKALKDSNDAIKANPEFSLAYNNRGYIYELMGSDKKAAEDYLKSCNLGLELGCRNFERLNKP